MADPSTDDLLPGSPPPSTLAAFREQATPDLYRAARRYAHRRAVLVRRAGSRVDHLYARELVQDALHDTWIGAAPWDPGACSLQTHICRLIRQRSWDAVRRARRFPHLSIHGSPENGNAVEVEAALRTATIGDLRPIALAGLTERVVAALRALAGADETALAILSCWGDGVVERHDVLARTGLPVPAYRAARERLAYAVMDLPRWLHDAAKHMLRSA